MNYTTQDGKPLNGASAKEIISALRGDIWEQDISLEEYMDRLSKRCMITYGVIIRNDSFENCVFDLVSNGILLPKV